MYQEQETLKVFTLGILMYDDVETLDFAGPFNVFTTASHLFQRFKVLLIADKKQIRAQFGLNVLVDYVIGDDNPPALNILLVPGTNRESTIAALNNPINMAYIKEVEPKLEYLLSVCTGVAILGKAGLLDNLDVTTHWQLFELANEYSPNSKLWRGRRLTDNGRVLTSAGISAGIDLALYFVKKMIGKPEADAIAERLEYDWKDEEYDECAGRLFTGGPDDQPILSFPRNF